MNKNCLLNIEPNWNSRNLRSNRVIRHLFCTQTIIIYNFKQVVRGMSDCLVFHIGTFYQIYVHSTFQYLCTPRSTWQRESKLYAKFESVWWCTLNNLWWFLQVFSTLNKSEWISVHQSYRFKFPTFETLAFVWIEEPKLQFSVKTWRYVWKELIWKVPLCVLVRAWTTQNKIFRYPSIFWQIMSSRHKLIL